MLLLLALAILAFAAAFHLYWALGGKVGFDVSLPQQPDGSPVMAHRLPLWRPAAGAVALCLLILVMLLLSRAGHIELPLPDFWIQSLLFFIGTALIARSIVPNRYVGFLKTLRTTPWAKYDTCLYSPLILTLGIAILRLSL
jgi:hypothetical protein